VRHHGCRDDLSGVHILWDAGTHDRQPVSGHEAASRIRPGEISQRGLTGELRTKCIQWNWLIAGWVGRYDTSGAGVRT